MSRDAAARTVETLFAPLSPREQRLALTLFRLLGAGAPVAPQALAAAAGWTQAACEGWLARVDGVQRDAAGPVYGFRGLSLHETTHRLDTGQATLFGWCAWDTLFLPQLIGCAVSVRSRCPESGAPVCLQVAPDGVRRAPEALRVSFVDPAASALHADLRGAFCGHIHMFATLAAGRRWAARHPRTRLLDLRAAEALARHHNRVHYGAALAAGAPASGKLPTAD